MLIELTLLLLRIIQNHKFEQETHRQILNIGIILILNKCILTSLAVFDATNNKYLFIFMLQNTSESYY